MKDKRDKYEEFQLINQEKQLKKLRQFNPHLYRVLTLVLKIRGNYMVVPDAFFLCMDLKRI